jgi:copper transport protein
MTTRKLIAAWSLVALLMLALVGTAAAHAELVSSNPAADARLAAAPAQVTLVFSEELAPDGNLVTVTDARGAQVDLKDTALDLNDPKRVTLTVSLKAGLGDGSYNVAWQNQSSDGHSEEGNFNFSVGTAATAPSAALPATGAGADSELGLLVLAGLLLLGVGLGLGLRRRVAR